MKRFLPLLTLLGLACGVHAQTITLKDGKTIPSSHLRRDGATVMTTTTVGSSLGEIGYAVAQIDSIQFPEPPQLKDANALIAAGKLDQALSAIEPVITFYRPFRDIKGNFWGDAAVLKLSIFIAQKRVADANGIISEMLENNTNPDVVASAKASKTLLLAWAGKSKEALAASDQIINSDASDSATLSLAYLANGEAHYALKEYEDAVMAFLHVPIFFPDQTLLMPKALIGSARSFAKLDSKNELDSAIQTLAESYSTSPEFNEAKTEFPSSIRRFKSIKN